MRLSHPQRLHRRGEGVSVEDRVNALDDVTGDVEKVTFVFYGDERAASAIVHADLQGFDQGAHGFEVTLDAEVAQDEQDSKN